MVNEPGTGPGFFSGSAARAAEASSAHSASGTTRSARLPHEADLTWMLMGAELPTRAASRVGVPAISVTARLAVRPRATRAAKTSATVPEMTPTLAPPGSTARGPAPRADVARAVLIVDR